MNITCIRGILIVWGLVGSVFATSKAPPIPKKFTFEAAHAGAGAGLSKVPSLKGAGSRIGLLSAYAAPGSFHLKKSSFAHYVPSVSATLAVEVSPLVVPAVPAAAPSPRRLSAETTLASTPSPESKVCEELDASEHSIDTDEIEKEPGLGATFSQRESVKYATSALIDFLSTEKGPWKSHFVPGDSAYYNNKIQALLSATWNAGNNLAAELEVSEEDKLASFWFSTMADTLWGVFNPEGSGESEIISKIRKLWVLIEEQEFHPCDEEFCNNTKDVFSLLTGFVDETSWNACWLGRTMNSRLVSDLMSALSEEMVLFFQKDAEAKCSEQGISWDALSEEETNHIINNMTERCLVIMTAAKVSFIIWFSNLQDPAV